MMDLKNINNNIISNRWKERCEKLPDEIKEKLNELDNSDVSDYQLQVIKGKESIQKLEISLKLIQEMIFIFMALF